MVIELASRLGVKDLPRLKRYYQRLEGGTRSTRADRRARLGRPSHDLRHQRPHDHPPGHDPRGRKRDGVLPPDDRAERARRSGAGESMELHERLVTLDTAPADRDELDRLFLGTE